VPSWSPPILSHETDPPLYVDQEQVLADTMQLLTGDREITALRDQLRRASPVPRRERATEPVARTVFARLSKGLILAVTAGITTAERSLAG
jgi:hypothetical protein